MSDEEYPEPRRQPLSRMQRYFQFYLVALFGNGVYVFSVIYAFLPSYLLESGYSTTDLSHAFGSDGIAHSAGLLVLLYINGLPRVNAMTLRRKFWLIVASSVITLAGSIMLTAVPSSYPVLVGSKALQGLAAAVYFSYAYTLINKLFPLEYQAQAAAFVTAGARLGATGRPCCWLIGQRKGKERKGKELPAGFPGSGLRDHTRPSACNRVQAASQCSTHVLAWELCPALAHSPLCLRWRACMQLSFLASDAYSHMHAACIVWLLAQLIDIVLPESPVRSSPTHPPCLAQASPLATAWPWP
jgi:hypothetical protein